MAVAEEFLVVSHFTFRRVWAHALQNFNNPTIMQLHASSLTKNNQGQLQNLIVSKFERQ
jgi:hypothetical protein